ncbi:hypothetical protein TNCV_2895331 [Trichonephila clavipes]|nr:hypothetical protein TNCV_2895331 [Trichonephila clavipes]
MRDLAMGQICMGGSGSGSGIHRRGPGNQGKTDWTRRESMFSAWYGRCYTRTIVDGPRNFEPWSTEKTTPELAPSPLLISTPHEREDVEPLQV